MSAPSESEADGVARREAAAGWRMRRERGLSAAESIEYELWLAADVRNGAALRTIEDTWRLLDGTPEPFVQRELAAAARRRVRRRLVLTSSSLMAAATIVFLAMLGWKVPGGMGSGAAGLVAAGPRELTLGDGSLVYLNFGSEVIEEFTDDERRVRLTRGEAHFTVMTDPVRPFVVVAGSLRVRAVGTAFNVNLRSSRIEVLVTEGRVQLATTKDAATSLIEAGERATVPTGKRSSIAVARVDSAEIARVLGWQDSLVRLGGATLADVAKVFENRFGERMVLSDPELAKLQVGGRLRGNNPQSFANLLAVTFDLEVERAADGAWVLLKKNPNSR